jgi:Domain of unknown function (DUF389)
VSVDAFNSPHRRYPGPKFRQGANVHHTIELAVPTDATDVVLADMCALEGVVQLSVERGASVKPAGDLVRAQVLNRDVDAVLAVASSAREYGAVSVATAEARSLVDETVARAIDDDIDEAPWEEFERSLRHHARINMNYLVLMAVGAAIAVAGLLSGSVSQALAMAAAGIIAPAFEPVAKLSVGLVRRSGYTVRRSLTSVGCGYLLLAVTGAVAYRVLYGLGIGSQGALAHSEEVHTVIEPSWADWLISAGGALAGVMIVTAYRHAVIAGALIALTLVPASALVGAALAAGDVVMALEALRRVAIDAALVVVLGAVVILVKQRRVHHNRAPRM